MRGVWTCWRGQAAGAETTGCTGCKWVHQPFLWRPCMCCQRLSDAPHVMLFSAQAGRCCITKATGFLWSPNIGRVAVGTVHVVDDARLYLMICALRIMQACKWQRLTIKLPACH